MTAKKRITLLSVFLLIVSAPLLLTACGLFASCGEKHPTDEPYLTGKKADSKWASFQFILVNPTDEDWEVAVKGTGTWVFLGGRTVTDGGTGIYKLRAKQTTQTQFVHANLNTGDKITGFDWTIEIITKYTTPPNEYGELFTVDWDDLPEHTPSGARPSATIDLLQERDYTVDAEYVSGNLLGAISDQYGLGYVSDVHIGNKFAYIGAVRGEGQYKEDYRIFYFNNRYTAESQLVTLQNYVETNNTGYTCKQCPGALNAIILSKIGE